MGDIKGFMIPLVTEETKDVIISKRFKDKDGNPLPFKIRALTQDENDAIRKQSSKPIRKNGMTIGQDVDSDQYGKRLVVKSVVEPNFADKDLCTYYGTMDPLDVPGKMLLAGEYAKLVRAINELNDFVTDDNLEDAEEEAKN